MTDDKVDVLNVNVPDHRARVRRDKYEAMRDALVAVLPTDPPGVSVREVLDQLKPDLPQDLFPDGKTSGWWQKTVQLDLEARGQIRRTPGRPLKIYKVQ